MDLNNIRDAPPSNLVATQLVISLALGTFGFLAFCVLRCRFPNIFMARLNYLSVSNKKYLPPQLDRKSLFGWIPVLFRITEDEVIQYAGLDAYVFLGFFKMSIRLLSVCWVFSTVVIAPIRYYFTGNYDDHDDPSKPDFVVGLNRTTPSLGPLPLDTEKSYLALYLIFTYVFTFVALHYLMQQAAKVIDKRQHILGNQCSITDRTILMAGVPPELRTERALKETIDSLGIGRAETIVVCKEWKQLDWLFRQRRYALEKLERAWAEYIGNNKSGFNVRAYRRDSVHMDSTAPPQNQYHDEISTLDIESPPAERTPSQSDDVESQAGLSTITGSLRKRPLVRLRPFFGQRVDAIDYYTKQLRAIDDEIHAARERHFASTPTAFVTLNSVAAAQMFAQAVVDPRIGYLITRPAPAPRDIIWENLTLPRKTRAYRQALITVITGILAVAFIFPVSYLATLLNMKTIRRFWPALGQILEDHPWAQNVVIHLLPVYLYTALNFIIPYIYVWLSSKQAFISHGDEELSVVSKNFFYVFVNMFLVFTLAGTASNYWGYLSDSKKLALQLAASLRSLSSFYVDTILLQGVGMHTFKLLLFGQLFSFPLVSARSKTPRHYLNLYRPPVFNFGLNLPIPLLTLVITLLYSVMSTKILSAGLAYFVIGFYVYKFQLIYSCIHTQHSTGQVMPIIFRRVVMGLLLFQLTMAGSLALSHAWVFSVCLFPLPLFTMTYLWYFQKNYQSLSYFIALRAVATSPNMSAMTNSPTISSTSASTNSPRPNSGHAVTRKPSTIDERREMNQTYAYPNLVNSLDGPWLAIENAEVIMASTDGISRKRLTFDEY